MSFAGSGKRRGGSGGGGSSVVVEATPGASASEINALIAGVAGEIGERAGGGRVFLPAGTYLIDTSILIRQHVVLEGEGPGTILQNDGITGGGAVIENAEPGDRRFGIRSLTIVAEGANYGISLNTPSTSPQEYADGIYTISDVEVFDAEIDGVVLEGRGQAIVRNVRVRDSQRHGFLIIAVDSIYDGLEAGGCGSAGIVVQGSNNRFTNCKTFWSGAITPTEGHGIWFDGTLGGQHCVLTNCETQDNNAHGVYFDEFHDVRVTGHISEGNNAGNYSAANQGGCGYYVDGSSDIKIAGSAIGRTSNAQKQRYALGMVNGAENLKADIFSKDNLTGHVLNGWHTNVDIAINAYGGLQDLSYSATRQPNPTSGNTVNFGALTGDMTVNAPAAANSWTGAKMTLKFTQDATGGRVITWGSGMVAYRAIDPTPSAVTVLDFVYDGTNWVEVEEAEYEVLNYPLNGGGVVLATGVQRTDVRVPFDCYIEKYEITADQSGSVVVDIWRDTYANYAPVDADSITASAPVTISSATKATNSTLTGWTRTLKRGDVLRFNVDSVTSITYATVALFVRKV